MALDVKLLLVTPLEVVRRLGTLVMEGDFWQTLLFSFSRIVLGFALAFALGCLLGVLSGKWRLLETLLWPYVVTIKAVPIASFIILCLIWFSFTQLTVFISFLIAFPVLYTNVLQGMKRASPTLREMADVYRVPWRRRLLPIYLPSVMPYLVSAAGVAAGMAWKAGVAAEVIGIVRGSVGEKLYEAKIYFQNADLLAWTVWIIVLSVLGEKCFTALLRAVYGRLIRR